MTCREARIRLFAYDAIVYCPIRQVVDAHLLQQELTIAVMWADKWQPKLNIKNAQKLILTVSIIMA